ncbi:hypothetical protein [Halosimplex pelagicum]|uniref:Uncharacterized protein n=1 Tax=Halosimplex pelagicum TaxID=869886 RepID=A0A7D5TBQ9_9EURY|nr:hypothetical protein [Halosimplex pelagicum]QLH82393.1 hypothetical protein HZS54_12535 [Halosimplex pelagicum]
MSQASSTAGQSRTAPLTQELNEDVDYFDGEHATTEEILNEYTDLPPEKQRGRPVLSYQVPDQIAEELLTSLPVTPLYRYSRETEATTAWKIGDTTKALIRYEDQDRAAGPQYMLPPLGETQLDLRWMMFQSIFREVPFTINYLPEETVRSILQTTRPEHRAGVEQLLNNHRVDQ